MIRILYIEKVTDKTCPFCGHKDMDVCSDPIEYHFNGQDAPSSCMRYVWMECQYCLARSPRKTIDSLYDSEMIAAAREAWNTRGGTK